MGGAPCWIIINCGALSAAARVLAETGPKDLSAAALYLSGIEDEICELGKEISPFLTAEDRVGVIKAGEDADTLRAIILNRLRDGAGTTITAHGLWEFAEDQRAFFRGLADRYKGVS